MTKKSINFKNISDINIGEYVINKNGESVRVKNVINNGLLLAVDGNEYFHKGITLEENSSVEILDATIEMHEKITGKWKFQEDQKIQSEKFLELFPTEIKDRDGIKLHGKIKSQIGYQFIKRNPYFLNN
jgi:hypothetical protein